MMRLTNHSRTLAMSFSRKRGFHLKRHSNFPLQFSVSMLRYFTLLVKGTSTKIIEQFKRNFILLLFAVAPISLEEESESLFSIISSAFLGNCCLMFQAAFQSHEIDWLEKCATISCLFRFTSHVFLIHNLT